MAEQTPNESQQPPKRKTTRTTWVATITAIVIIIAIIIVAASCGEDGETEKTNTTRPTTTAEETTAPELPLVDFSGSIAPSAAITGEKVVIEVTVTNLDNTKIVDGLRLVFSGKIFEDGLVVTGVMNGGVQKSDTAFEWNMTVPPGETITYTIVCAAKEPGNYDGTVILKPPGSSTSEVYEDPAGYSELGYQLAVTP